MGVITFFYTSILEIFVVTIFVILDIALTTSSNLLRGCRDHMVVGFTTTYELVSITTKVVSLNPAHGKVYSIQQYVIRFVSDLRQIIGFLLVLRFPPPIKLTATI